MVVAPGDGASSRPPSQIQPATLALDAGEIVGRRILDLEHSRQVGVCVCVCVRLRVVVRFWGYDGA